MPGLYLLSRRQDSRGSFTPSRQQSLQGLEEAFVRSLEQEQGLRWQISQFAMHRRMRDYVKSRLEANLDRPAKGACYLGIDFQDPTGGA